MDNVSPISILENPNLEATKTNIMEALSKKRSIILVGHCWVEYIGRARSILEPGERVIFIKEDGAVLIHRSTGYKPVNWQPPECYFRISVANDKLIVEAFRRKIQESLKIFFDNVYVIALMKLVDQGRFYLHVSEREIQEAILKNPELVEEAFEPISFEKRVEPGFIDVYGLDSEGRLVVVEIKRGRAGKDAVIQLAKYVEFVKSNTDREVRGILAAPQITKGMQKMIVSLSLEYKRIDLKKCAQVITVTTAAKIQDFF
ncbi:MAG: endonuclease NucS [Candidatus Methylarchaceae archaeon HK01M]|nr:endonuclease NucS [Candidatus Methylarchaceae archaeon HK01M]